MTLPYKNIVKQLSLRGICKLPAMWDCPEITDALSCVARRPLSRLDSDLLREPGPETPHNWLSYGHKADYLPVHTDYPDWETPPRFILLRCLENGILPIQTVFYDIAAKAISHRYVHTLLTEPWLTTAGASKYKSIRLLEVDEQSGAPRIRYSTNVMRPFFQINSDGERILRTIVESTLPSTTVLIPKQQILWDNWRFLHGRTGAASSPQKWAPGKSRVLERVMWT